MAERRAKAALRFRWYTSFLRPLLLLLLCSSPADIKHRRAFGGFWCDSSCKLQYAPVFHFSCCKPPPPFLSLFGAPYKV